MSIREKVAQSELAIADYFKWSLDKVRDLTVYDMRMIKKYMKKIQTENKKASGKSGRYRGR